MPVCGRPGVVTAVTYPSLRVPILRGAGRYRDRPERTCAEAPAENSVNRPVSRMRELERTAAAETTVPAPLEVASIALVGRGRVGRTLAGALREAGYRVSALGRDERPAGADAILLCVPDAEIGAAARAVAGAAAYVGHTSGATPLSALEPAGGEAFGLHPLQTIPAGGADLRGCGAAVAGATDGALEVARAGAGPVGVETVARRGG